jgi:hypothetical protein
MKWITYLLLVNFVNLSANFYQASVMDSILLENHDPIDSITELVLEYVLEMDDETIPDTEVPHEKRKIVDFKILIEKTSTNFVAVKITFRKDPVFILEDIFENIHLEQSSPPPKYFI